MAIERIEGIAGEPSSLRKILPVTAVLGILGVLGYLLTEGTANSRFLQVGCALAGLVYLITFIDVLVGLAVLIACIGLSPEVSLAGLNDLRLEDFVIPALLVAWITRALHKRETMAPAAIGTPALLYFSALSVSTILGVMAGSTSASSAIPLWAKSIEYFLLFIIVVNNVRTEGEFRSLVLFSIVVAVVSGIVGTQGAAASPEAFGPLNRAHGPMGETANIFGGYIIMNLAIVAGLYLHCRTGVHRVGAGIAIVALGTTLLYTYSRTSYGGLLIALIAFGILKERRLLVVLLILSVLFPFMAPESVMNRMSDLGTVATGGTTSSWASRVYSWSNNLGQMRPTDWLWGRGAGSLPLGEVDNEYVHILIDAGLLGLGLFLWLLFRLWRTIDRAHSGLAPGTFARGIAAGYLIMFFAMAVHAVAATSFTSIRTMETFMFWSGMAVCMVNRRQEWKLETVELPSAVLATLPPALAPRF